MPERPVDDSRRIVVGVDGSGSSRAALRWAVRQAELTGAWVEAVTVWHFPAYYGMAPLPGGLEGYARSMLRDVLSQVVGPESAADVHPQVVQGSPARVLLDAAKGADLLVVGSRGHSGFAEALLGSVGQHCVHHATCPVVVVRDDSTPGAAF